MLSRPFTSFVALLLTHSSILTSFWYCAQICTQYSNWGHKNAKYNKRNLSSDHLAMRFAFLDVQAHILSLQSTSTPRTFLQDSPLITLLPVCICVWHYPLLGAVTRIYLCWISYRCWFSNTPLYVGLSNSSRESIALPSFVSSANMLGMQSNSCIQNHW